MGWVTAILFVVSLVMQQQAAAQARKRQKRMQEEAAARADAAKGYIIPVEGEAVAAGIPYGRNLLGGVRVYHQSFNNFNFASTPGMSYFYNGMSGSLSGSKHEFLIIQQVLGFGELNSCVTIDVDGRRFNDAAFSTTGTEGGFGALMFSVCLSGNRVDNLAVANDASRATAAFTNVAYATGVFKLNRDDPQFAGVPQCQFYVEGLKIPTLLGNPGARYLGPKAYSNNSALCLLDYLTNNVYGRGLPVSSIDLDSFYDAMLICDTVVVTDAPVEGAFWKAKSGVVDGANVNKGNWVVDTAYNVTDLVTYNGILYQLRYALPAIGLYRGAWTVNTAYQLGERVLYNGIQYVLTSISETINTAEDNWLFAKYNSTHYIAPEYTWSFDLGHGPALTPANDTNWSVYIHQSPPSTSGYWHALDMSVHTIKLYECNTTLSSEKSVRDNIETILETMNQAELIWSGGKYKLSLKYPSVFATGQSYSLGAAVQYTEGYNIDLFRNMVQGNTLAPNFTIPPGGTGNGWSRDVVSKYITDDDIIFSDNDMVTWPNSQGRFNYVTVKFNNEAKDFAQDSVSWPPKTGYIYGTNINKGTWDSTTAYSISDIVTYSGTQYQLASGDNRINAVVPPSDPVWVVYNTSSIYKTFKDADNGIPLETEFFESGITDYYHALAKAEQRVRYSRTNVIYNFKLMRNMVALEPGDVINVNSAILNIPGELLRVDEVDPDDNGDVKIVASMFDANTIKWNISTTEVIVPRNLYTDTIAQATNIDFVATPLLETAGTLTWDAADDVRVGYYQIKYATSIPANGNIVWVDLGSTSKTSFDIMPFTNQTIYLTVVATTLNGRQAPQTDSINGTQWPIFALVPSMFHITDVSGGNYTINSSGILLSWTNIAGAKLDHFEVREGTSWDTGTIVGVPTSNSLQLSYRLAGNYTFLVKAITKYGDVSTNAMQLQVTVGLPADVSAIDYSDNYITITANTDAWIQGYIFKYNMGNNLDWNLGIQLQSEPVTLFPYRISVTLVGTVTILCRAIDKAGNISNASVAVIKDLGDPYINNVVATYAIMPNATPPGTYTGGSVVSNKLYSAGLDVFYGDAAQSFYSESTNDLSDFYDPSSYSQMVFTTNEYTPTTVLVGSLMSYNLIASGTNILVEYRELSYAPFYDTVTTNSFYGVSTDDFYGNAFTGPWLPFTTVQTSNVTYQYRITTGYGLIQGVIDTFTVIIDAPDIVETVSNLSISSSGTTIPYTSSFTNITNIQATLQTNGSGAETIEVNKSSPLAPTIKAFNSSHTAVSGATADITLKGY